MFYQCPICRSPLELNMPTWQCHQGHCFDRAKEGYVNLLPVQNKKSKDPGDNKTMMQARREFLNAGHYQHLSDRVGELALEFAPQTRSILDIGCGEGYYSDRLFNVFSSDNECQLHGLDISKSAVRYASKRYKQMHFCVASVFDMPFVDQSFDLALRIYAPSDLDELKRVICPEGLLITVAPGPMHHFEVKEKIYSDPQPHPESIAEIDGFECLHYERLRSRMNLIDAKDIQNFLQMTPYAWKLTETQKKSMANSNFECELDFQIEVHKLR
ncbi:23S rRNA (guanine(745)-N(1))-methyltransferase [Shewanella gelidii]|uniref:23S rRNA (Guanine(745)-N(1))-methyltransferase n=1 Tax=Shewanella gelidii TaxID=1642821 RepID=A0A917JYN3_9GAMM|nr:23S rRNA (guanine(745)-N(1))-methyltransferase [Shewanella gelidii]MCL1099707.1 23S rRNA (guanine(745)-N(1))-methyltransferase [Shewanella gelidii]GGI89232.1 23S rRNA (guanine(745)-N(1))-methyltransferase [Shewanella gelidii]